MDSLVPARQNAALTDLTREKTFSILILDSSGSMQRFGFTPIEVANKHVQALADANDGREYYFGLVTFANMAKVEIGLSPVADIIPLEIYHPSGGTRLWETVYSVIDRLLNFLSPFSLFDRQKIQIAISVITDGEDNMSDRERFPEILQRKAKEIQNLGWKLLCYGIGIDAEKTAKNMGFPLDPSLTVRIEPTHEGVRGTSIHMTQTIRGTWVPKNEPP